MAELRILEDGFEQSRVILSNSRAECQNADGMPQPGRHPRGTTTTAGRSMPNKATAHLNARDLLKLMDVDIVSNVG